MIVGVLLHYHITVMQLPPPSVRTPCLWSALLAGLEAESSIPGRLGAQGSCLFTDEYKKIVYDCYLQELGNTRQNEERLSFVSLNLCVCVSHGGELCLAFGVMLFVQRNDVDLIEVINCHLKTVGFLLS